MNDLQLLLASQSPRRAEILSRAGFLFRVDPVKLSEIIGKNVNPRVAIEGLALAKGQAAVMQHKPLKGQAFLVLAADTMVVRDGVPLGKPADAADAVATVMSLSGREHEVITAISLWNLQTGEHLVRSDSTTVQFRTLTQTEVEVYVQSGEPFDKAGSYGIQGPAGKWVTRIEGSFENVMGFPIQLFERILKERQWTCQRQRPGQ
jgi:septum formation protein